MELVPKQDHIPIEFEKNLIDKAERIARTGASIPRIAEGCLVDPRTFRRWMEQGRDDPEHYILFSELYQRVSKARNTAHDNLLGKVMESSQEDWKAASWVLERSFGYHKNNETPIQELAQPMTLELIARIPLEQIQIVEAEGTLISDEENKTTNIRHEQH